MPSVEKSEEKPRKLESETYILSVLQLYVSLPHTPKKHRPDDRFLALRLQRRRVPFRQVEAALLLGPPGGSFESMTVSPYSLSAPYDTSSLYSTSFAMRALTMTMSTISGVYSPTSFPQRLHSIHNISPHRIQTRPVHKPSSRSIGRNPLSAFCPENRTSR